MSFIESGAAGGFASSTEADEGTALDVVVDAEPDVVVDAELDVVVDAELDVDVGSTEAILLRDVPLMAVVFLGTPVSI